MTSTYRIGCTIGGRILRGRMDRNGLDFSGTPEDVTSEVVKAMVDKVGIGKTSVISQDGQPWVEISIRDLSASVAPPVSQQSEHGGQVAVTDAMVDAYLTEQRRTVEEADRAWGRPNVGGLHTNTVREACRNGLRAALTQAEATTAPVVQPGFVVVPVKPTREMLNAAVDVDSFKLGDISPLGFRCSPQMLFERCYAAMLAATPTPSALKPAEALQAEGATYEPNLRAVLDVVQRYLPPNGLPIDQAMNEIIEIVDPWPTATK